MSEKKTASLCRCRIYSSHSGEVQSVSMAALQYLESMRDTYDALSKWYDMLADQYQRESWPELAQTLEHFTSLLPFQSLHTDPLIQLYDNFIIDLESEIGLFKLAQFAVKISSQYSDFDAAIDFLNGVIEKHFMTGESHLEQPRVLIEVQIALLLISLEDLKGCKNLLDGGKTALDSMTDIDPLVYSTFYWASAQYHKYRRDFAEHYRNFLLYLDYAPVDLLIEPQKQALAYELSTSALMGENIYNFGELLAHPIIQSLMGSQYEWIYQILKAVVACDADLFQALCQVHKSDLNTHPLLKNAQKLLDKIDVLSLLEAIFSLQSENTTIPLSAIAERSNFFVRDVERLVVKCLSVHLIEGVVDQVSGTVYVSWVEPRAALGMPEIESARDRFDKWIDWLDRNFDIFFPHHLVAS